MRNVLLILLIVVLLAPSCKKDYCWECETQITTLVVSVSKDSVKTVSTRNDLLCDRTDKEIRAAEKENTLTQTTLDSNTKQTTYRTFDMDCKKQK